MTSSSRSLLPLFVAIALLALSPVLAAPGALPVGPWTAQPGFISRFNDQLTLGVNSMGIVVHADGTNFDLSAEFNSGSTPGPDTVELLFSGSAVCSTSNDAMIISVNSSTCVQIGSVPGGPLCQFVQPLYAGEFHYGATSESAPATFIINRWSGSPQPIIFQCAGVCNTQLACNTTVDLMSNFYQTGGTAIINGSQTVILTGNSSAVFQGNEITIANSNNFTLQQSSNMTDTTVGPLLALLLLFNLSCLWGLIVFPESYHLDFDTPYPHCLFLYGINGNR
jgi:hypothetical protein